MFSNAQDATPLPPPPLLLHPHDPCVEEEYEALIRGWKTQLIDHTPTEPSHDYVRLAWMRLMDHYLDQHWLDSKQMLQCAQAWSARDELSLAEAVHTMNILSLKAMQRLMDARQELLQALGDPDLIGITAPPKPHKNAPSLTGSEEEDVHAPLLVQHTNTTPTQESFNLHRESINNVVEEKSIEEECFPLSYSYDLDELIDLSIEKETFVELKSRHVIEDENEDETEKEGEEEGYEEQKRKEDGKEGRGKEEEEEATEYISPLVSRIYSQSISSSMSSPNISTSVNRKEEYANRKYESYYQNPHQVSPWKEITTTHNSDLLSENSFSSNSEVSSPLVSNSVQWKSWFLGDQSTGFAKEKVETDPSFSEYVKKQPFLMVRSESSISTFRPISNNLAPRCQAAPVITKSRSFPSKSALSASMKKSSSTPPPIPQQRNFMIRSIVSKKASLSKLFSSRKGSSSN